MADDPVGQPPRQPQPLPAEGQVGGPALGTGQVARRAHDLEAAVQHEGMEIEPVPGQGFGQGDLSQRLARTGPDAAEGAEGRTEIDAGARPVAVVAGHVRRRQTGLQALQVDAPANFRNRGTRRHAAFHVDRPVPFAPLAEDLDPARRRLGSVEHDLHLAAFLTRLLLLLLEDQRVVQLQVLHDHRPDPLGEGGRCRHGAVERPRRHDPVEDLVIAHPRRIGGEDLGLEGELAAGGLVADAQQGVARTPVLTPGRLDPVMLALEGIARQGDPPPTLPREESREADREPRLVRLRNGVQETVVGAGGLDRIARRRAETGKHHRRSGRLRPGGGCHGRQHRARADLQHRVHPELRQRPHPLGEGDRLPGMAPPVGSVLGLAGFDGPAGQIADHGESGRLDRHAVEERFQLVQDGLDEGAVEGPGRVQPPDADSLLVELLRDRFDCRDRAADHLVAAVVARDAQAGAGGGRVHRLHRRGHPLGGCEDRGHAALGHLRHQPAPHGGEPHPVLEAEDARGLGRRQLPDAVSHDHVGPYADAGPQRRQGALQRVEGGLLPRRIPELSLSPVPAEHHVQEGFAPFVPEDGLAAVQNRPRYGLARVESPAHADPLASLPGIDESDPGRRSGRGTRAGLRQRGEALAQRGEIAEDDAGPVREVTAPDSRRPGHVRKHGLVLRTTFAGMLVEP